LNQAHINLPRYVFHIPLFNDYSNGIQILWHFAEYVSLIREIEVIPFAYNEPDAYIPSRMKGYVKETYSPKDGDVIIYPESIRGNPLNAKRVCRYILARPYTLNGQWIDYSSSDFVFYYSGVISDGGEYLTLQNEAIFEHLQSHLSTPVPRQDKVLIYYGKLRCGVNLNLAQKLAEKFESVEIITRKHPETKSDLYRKIKESRLFISLDPLTNLCYEATLLGTPAYFADSIFESAYMNYRFPLHGFIPSASALEIDYKKYPNEELSIKAIKEFRGQLEKNQINVTNLLAKAEEFFSTGEKIDVERTKNVEREFITHKWGLAPIVSGTNFNSVIGYHLITYNPYIYITAKTLWRMAARLRALIVHVIRAPKSALRWLWHFIFDTSDPIVGHYLRNQTSLPDSVPSETHRLRKMEFADSPFKRWIINLIWRRSWK
jgi:hypothetical protein